MKRRICYLALAAGDYGGASRFLYTLLGKLDRDRFQPEVIFGKTGPLLPTLDEMRIEHRVWGPCEPNSVSRYAADVAKALCFLATSRIDLVHVNHVDYWRPAPLLAAHMLRIPIVTHFHIVATRAVPYLKYSSLIVANSEFTASHSVQTRIPCRVVYNFVDLGRYDRGCDVRAEMGVEANQVVVSFVGQVREAKGIESFIRLAHRLRGRGARFLIAGECRDAERFEGSYTQARLMSEIGDNEEIRYIGYRNDIENLYRSTDILVMPSRWDEPFGLINIEAGAAGKPIVATRVGGIPEIIRHGENGFLVDRDDIDSMAEYTARLIDDPALREEMGRAGRRIVEERFDNTPVRELEHLYEQLIDNRGRLAKGA